MRVFGIDCGTEFTGYGVVEVDCDARLPKLVHLAAGTIRLSKKEKTPQRLAQVYSELVALITLHEPECVAIEEVFFSANAKSALKLGQVRGVAMLAAATCGMPVAEYAPLSIKSSVVGYGLAAKEQVQFMVMRLLELDHAPDSPDAADALAIAICHIHTTQTLQLQGGATVSGIFARVMVVAALSISANVMLGQVQQSTAAPATQGGATITYQFERTAPGVSVPRYTVVLHEDGSGTYHAEEVERRSADSALQQVSTKIIDRPMTVSADTTAKIFQTARALNRFNVFCGTKVKNIADTGKKTLSYAGSDGSGSCTYNYSDDKSVMDLTDLFYGIVYTMDVGRKLDFERRFDRLGLDAEMIALEQAVKDKHALELGNIAPTLQKLASDPEMMQRVQTRAAKLLVLASAGK